MMKSHMQNSFGKSLFGMVQGRLIQSPKGHLQWFPQDHWESEFFIASAIGFDFIELIVERNHNGKNPVWSDEGVSRIKSLCERNHLSLYAICNDYIVDHPLAGKGDALKQAHDVISRADLLGTGHLVLPLFEKSEMSESNFDEYKTPLLEIASHAKEKNITVCLETILDGKGLIKLFEHFGDPDIKCVFDTGNRIAFGHDIYSDIVLLGNHIQHVHIKDKDEANNNVLLGTGKVNFHKVFQSLAKIQYSKAYTFETTRGNNPVRTAQYNKYFVEFFMGDVSRNGN